MLKIGASRLGQMVWCLVREMELDAARAGASRSELAHACGTTEATFNRWMSPSDALMPTAVGLVALLSADKFVPAPARLRAMERLLAEGGFEALRIAAGEMVGEAQEMSLPELALTVDKEGGELSAVIIAAMKDKKLTAAECELIAREAAQVAAAARAVEGAVESRSDRAT